MVFLWVFAYFVSIIVLLSLLTSLREPFTTMMRSDVEKSDSYYLDRLTVGYDSSKQQLGFYANSGEFIGNSGAYDAKKSLVNFSNGI